MGKPDRIICIGLEYKKVEANAGDIKSEKEKKLFHE